MKNLAKKLGIKCWIENGRIKFEGAPGMIKKMWAIAGMDIIKDGSTSWKVEKDGEYLAAIMSDGDKYCYSYTIKA